MSAHSRDAGFSLLELLMLAAIAVILSVLIVPNFMDYSGKSSAQTTRANLELIRSSLSEYRSDNSGRPPQTLEEMVPEYLPALPPDGYRNRADELQGHVDDRGGWKYDPRTGRVTPNLVGEDAYGNKFGEY